MLSLEEILALISGIAGAVGAIYGLWKLFHKKIVIPFHKFMTRIASLDKIYYALTPNGGSSMYDRLVSMDKKISFADFRTRALLTYLDIGEMRFDVAGNCISVSGTICRSLNRIESEFLGSNWLNTITEPDRDDVIARWSESIKLHHDFIMNFTVLSSDNEILPVSIICTPLNDSIQKQIGWAATLMIKTK